MFTLSMRFAFGWPPSWDDNYIGTSDSPEYVDLPGKKIVDIFLNPFSLPFLRQIIRC